MLNNCTAMSLKASKVAKSDQHYLQTALPSNCKILQLDNCFRVRREGGGKVPVLYTGALHLLYTHDFEAKKKEIKNMKYRI